MTRAVQDTTDLDSTAHPATTGRGKLVTPYQHGLFVPTTRAGVPPTDDQPAVPLGLLAQTRWAREPAPFGRLPAHKRRALAAKESRQWVERLGTVNRLAGRLPPGAQLVSGCDRAGAVSDLCAAPRAGGVHRLVRAGRKRRGAHPHPYRWPARAAAPLTTTSAVSRPRRPGRPARTAALAVRFRPVTLRPPVRHAGEPAGPVPLRAVWAHERPPPPGMEPVSWLLLTTRPVAMVAGALTVMRWYTGRWGSEVGQRLLKTGGGSEDRRRRAAAERGRCLTLASIRAWRVLPATRLARRAPEQPCTAIRDAAEWAALCCLIRRDVTLPAAPPDLGTAVHWLARLGGHQPRAHRRPPGPVVVWRGFPTRAPAVAMYRLLKPHLSSVPP